MFALTKKDIKRILIEMRTHANEDVVNYDFYRPENIYVYDGQVDLNNVFFKSEYVDVESEIYKKYSLRSWLSKIIDGV